MAIYKYSVGVYWGSCVLVVMVEVNVGDRWSENFHDVVDDDGGNKQ